MLFRRWPMRLLPRYRRLMRNGIQAEAVVIRSEGWGWYTYGGQTKQKLRLEVFYGDGTTAEIERVEENHIIATQCDAGSTLPVRHEATDRTYVEIDRNEARRRFATRRAEWAERDEAKVRDAKARLARNLKPSQEPPRDQP